MLLLKREITNPHVKGYGYVFEVHHDFDGLQMALDGKDFDLGSEEDNQEYKNRFINGELNVYLVAHFSKCATCGSYNRAKEEASVCGIHAEDEYEALEYYVSNYCA